MWINYLQSGIIIKYITNLIIPLMVLIIIIYGVRKKIDVYDVFIDGSKESLGMIKDLFPTFLAMILGVNILINSGFLSFILSFIKPLFSHFQISLEILPMAVIRPISGSASLAILNSIYQNYGPDSFVGILSSVMQGSTDTTLYVPTAAGICAWRTASSATTARGRTPRAGLWYTWTTVWAPPW